MERRAVPVPFHFIAVAVVLLLFAASCGSAKKDEALRAEQSARSDQPAEAPLSDPGEVADPTEGPDPEAVTAPEGTGPSPGGGGIAVPSSGVTQPSSGASGGSGSPSPPLRENAKLSGGASPTPARAESAPPGAPDPAQGQPPPGDVQSPAPQAPKDPIKIGIIVTGSGPIGAALTPVVAGAKVWLADINGRGGLNGHPVHPVFGDDAGDPNRALALAKRMVEKDKVVVFFATAGPTTLQAVAPYIEEKKVPLFEVCSCNSVADTSPMMFPVANGSSEGTLYGHILPVLLQSDKRKIAVLYCREVNSCAYSGERIKDREIQSKLGYEVVYAAQVTVAAPDYTAEVLAARNAGADAVITVIDLNSTLRIVRSAHRQGWKPVFGTNWNAQDERFLRAGGSEFGGFIAGGQIPVWTSPLLADYRAAVKKFNPDMLHAGFSAISWVNGKLLEKLSERFTGTRVTSNDVLEALYALRGETLGGLLPPTAYRRDVGHGDSNLCTFPVQIANGQFVPWKGGEYVCAPHWKPIEP